jgi:protein TonB
VKEGENARPVVNFGSTFLWPAILLSVAVHGLLLSLHFRFPEASKAFRDHALDIILVNSRSATKPADAQAQAQADIDGGGNSEENRRAKTPLPAAPKQQPGDELDRSRKRVQELEARQQHLATQSRSKQRVVPSENKEIQPETAQPSTSGIDLADSSLAMIRQQGEIAKEIDEYNKRPRKTFIGTRASAVSHAQYIEDWRAKVERIGTLNYPSEARGKLYGKLIMTISIRKDGSLENVEINESSGHKILDDAARRIVRMGAPYGAFPPAMRQETGDIIVFVRTLTFTQRDSVATK